MLVPPVAQSGTGDRPVGDTVARAQQTTGPGAATTTLWPLAPAQSNQVPNQQSQGIPPLAATPAPAHNQGANRYGLYSLFPEQPMPARAYHATHKERTISESVFSAAVGVGVGGYTWGAPTPPPGSPYSPVPVTQLELLAKNLANLAPAAATGQQALSLQGVGVNVAGSLHHAQHTTQHTQHTLNLTGIHHLHHGGLHQNTFSPQLSLVTGSAPTLTINNFSSQPTSTNGIAPTTGVLLQEYQPPIGATAATGCTVTVNGSSCLTNTSSTTSSMMMHGGGIQATGNQIAVQATATKKREAFLSSQGQPVKLENKSTRTSCLCRNSNGKTKVVHSDVGCSRTLPVASSWNGQDSNAGANNSGASLTVKREPLASVPCQVAEVSTSLHATTTSVKIEPVPKSENGIAVSNAGAGGIPVGIAVARQRLQHQETSTSMRNVSLSHHTSHHATSYHHFQPDSLGSSTAMAVGGTTLVHCGGPGGEDRAAHLAAIPSGALAPSLSLNSSLNSTLGSIGGGPAAAADTAGAAWPPTLWQYPATAAAAMPTEPVGFPQMGSGLQGGLQLVRDPTTGHILLIHAAEQMQQALVWPNYSNHSNNIAPPPLLLPPPPPSIQLLGDIGGARLVLTENKRKQQSALPIVKIETECSNSPTTIITSTESSKTALQTMTSVTGALVPDAALVTTLHYYPQAPALVQISQAEPTTTHCRSQATSPVSCLTPPPEIPAAIHTIETSSFGVQDASNQTDAPEDTEEKQETLVKQEQNLSPCQVVSQSTGSNLTAANFEIVPSPTERICNVVRITTTTTTVNPTVCGIVTKVDKAENTIINMADCAKYSAKDGKSLMKTIEQDSRVDEEVCTDDKMTPISSRGSRLGARIIEITEENCDSFHENLEFFARRRDISAEQRDHRDYSMDEENVVQKSNSHEKKIEPKINDVSENIEVHHQTFSKTSAPPVIETKSNVADSTESSRINCESCDKDRNTSNSETRPQITVKSFDMPNIDCDDQEMQQVAIKQEADDSCYEMCYESSQCEPTSTSERYRSSCEKSLQEATKRHSTEKSHHPGIENVVEKLKKNAAALQEAALPSAQKIEESVERSNVENVKLRRYSETIPKKLHLLRSCQNSLESGTVDTEISSSQTPMSEQHLKDQSGRHSPHHRDMASSECLLNENNNDSRSNNNNIKAFEDKKLLAKNEKNVSHDITAYVKPKTVWRCEVQPFEKPNVIRKSNDHEEDTSTETKSKVQRQKPAIDVSGLELLSNSIEQLEQRVGQPEHLQLDADAEKSPVKSKLISPQSESNNNNVGSPLGLLCALAEQIMQVGDKVPRKLNLESSEEISQAGRLLLNLGRSNSLEKDENKRKYIETDDHLSKRFKFQDCEEEAKNVSQNYEKDVKEQTMEVNKRKQEDALKSKEAIKNINNFSEEEINRISDERTIGLEEQSLNRDECYSNTKTVKNLQVSSDKTSNNLLSNDAFYKNVKEDKLSDSEGEMFESKVLSEESTSCEIRNNKRKMSVEERDVRESHDYKNARTKLEAKKFIAKKGNRDNEDDWPSMNATELDMRVRMADIQRQYREKQKELSKLIPKKDEKKYSGRPRKKSHSSTSSDHGTLSSPPALDLMTSPSRESPSKSPERGTPSPLASAVLTMPKCNVNLVKLGEPKSHIKLLDNIPSIPTSVPPVTSPIPALPGSSNAIPEDDEKSTGTLGYDTSSPAPTVVNSTSASKKRKVGRPRKLTCTSGSARHLTETIVAKKPKSKSSLVGYVLSSKNRHLQTKQCINSKAGYTPLPFKSGVSSPKLQTKIQKVAKMKTKPAKQTPLHNKNVISSIIAEKAKLSQEVKLEKHCSKIKPKLKAEVKVKNWEDDENDMVQPENIVPPEELTVQTPVKEMPTESVEMLEKEPERSRHDKSKKKKRKSSSSQSPNRDRKESKRRKSLECKQCAKAAAAKTSESIVNRCKLTSAHLAIDQLRVLMAMGGLFYAGRLSAVQAPDVYAITLDGERGNRPHIHSREEILQDAIVEVCPTSTKELPPGTRLCAYWSQQYRCLYPGTSVKPLVPDLQNDEKFVTVEFDDGDSGLIVLDDIRLLQPNYPVVVYDPNPLLSLGKRRRQTSTSEDKRSTGNLVVPSNGQGVPSTSRSVAASNNSFATCPYVSNVELASANECAEAETETNVDTSSTSGTEYRKKKHMKKIKKKKLLETQEGKKKHRKHRSCKEHRKHKHRKHRKHKHRHHGSNSDTKDGSRENSWEQKNEEEAITDLSNTNFSAVEETRLSEEEDETEESLVTAEKDNEAQVELEEPDSKLVDKDDDVQVTTSEPSVPIQQTEIEPEEKESTQQTQIESEEPLETDQVGDETQMESEEDVQENDEEPEEPPEPVKKKLKKASTNRASTNRATINRTSTNQGSTVRGSTSRALANRVSMNRTTTNRALTRHASTVQTSTSCSSTNRASKNRASNPTTPANPPNPVETPSPIARMLPNKRHWKWASSSRVSGGNQYFTAIKRGRETINIGDSVLFYSYRKPHEKPYIGKIVSLWLNQKLEMRVRSQWFYRPEELQPPCSLNPPGGLFESKHSDSNDVQTISHKVMVLPLEDYNKTLQQSHRHQKGYEDNDPYYYYAGFYTHPTVTYAPGVKAVLNE
ncbi:uncharacterized protein LOC105840034 isoform X3 [Monomorium pharaonis]|uniref:uncharacterized protein LOC105840034 isoform X3 n=1 Tax=Monomorium pharaonis TaxID=307658 RepID=UPI00174695B9|nr:uncharacterized protein LOC105840034 isoform X3 [Monomorium pharaonis]